MCMFVNMLFQSVQETITEIGTLSWLNMKALVWILGDYKQYESSKKVIRKFIGNVSQATQMSIYLHLSTYVPFINIYVYDAMNFILANYGTHENFVGPVEARRQYFYKSSHRTTSAGNLFT